MINTKLILIDGIFGSGKSTITKLVSGFMTDNDISNIFYEEEDINNPLYLDYCEDVIGIPETRKFITKTLDLWKSFIDSINLDNNIYIIESSFFQNTIRILFNNQFSDEEINNYYNNVLEIIKPTNPQLIYLFKPNVRKSINDIWNIRGEDFKNYCIEFDSKTLYSVSNALQGEDATIMLWENYQDLTDKLFIKYPYDKKHIVSDTNDWDRIYTNIFSFLGCSTCFNINS